VGISIRQGELAGTSCLDSAAMGFPAAETKGEILVYSRIN
jgi:hypothetical protein